MASYHVIISCQLGRFTVGNSTLNLLVLCQPSCQGESRTTLCTMWKMVWTKRGDRDRRDLTGGRLQSASKVCRLSEIAFLVHAHSTEYIVRRLYYVLLRR
jgi:hypothetical protein